jgi:Icc-related predicted phosphoesterase
MLRSFLMRVTAISDLHGAVERLDAVAGECDVLLVLGDLINVLDYRSMDGILVEVFGREPVAEAARLVHQPLIERGNIGLTELVNVGHFQATGRGFTIEVPN